MFYSQFILAKKGPLGTIWIAAHLERKLRRNQVADTDIGVSVDSILFPEAPIALRLSSHLLLGVVRIYSRKVNYLFHDCSEALLKIKQAFRSTAVDLPPEESTAPYHSITLPETFHLDDFELPDSAFQGDVDHHVSTKEQITLQDNLEKTEFSTSKFGLDERFGDGNVSHIGLDLDEDLFLNKDQSAMEHSSVRLLSNDNGTFQQGQSSAGPKDMDLDQNQNEFMDGEKDEDIKTNQDLSNWSGYNIQTPGYNIPTPGYNIQTPAYNIQTPDLNEIFFSHGHMEGSSVPATPFPETPFHEEAHSPETTECAPPSTPGLMEETVHARVSDASPSVNYEDAPKADNNSVPFLQPCSVNVKAALNATSAGENIQNEEGNENVGDPVRRVSLDGNADKHLLSFDAPNMNCEVSDMCIDLFGEKNMPVENGVILENATDMVNLNDTVPDSSGGVLGAETTINDEATKNLEFEQAQLQFKQTPNIDNMAGSATTTEFPEPEKVLLPPGFDIASRDNELGQVTVERAVSEMDGSIDRSFSLIGQKRPFEDDSLLHFQNSTERVSSRQRVKKTNSDFLPLDNDVLTAILAGKSTPGLHLRSTPNKSSLPKRQKMTPKTGMNKRKLQLDDAMVLHADVIRQQLINTEDICRLRKKAPCTRAEIWIIEKGPLEDEIFSETLFSGATEELSELQQQTYEIDIFKPLKQLIRDSKGKDIEPDAPKVTNEETVCTPYPKVTNEETVYTPYATTAEHASNNVGTPYAYPVNSTLLDPPRDEPFYGLDNDNFIPEQRFENNNEQVQPNEEVPTDLDKTDKTTDIGQGTCETPLHVPEGNLPDSGSSLIHDEMDKLFGPAEYPSTEARGVENVNDLIRDDGGMQEVSIFPDQQVENDRNDTSVVEENSVLQKNNAGDFVDMEGIGHNGSVPECSDFYGGIEGVDTDFLNADEEVDYHEEAGDDADDIGDVSALDNSGWSSRTRGVARYLKLLFDEETGHRRKSAAIDHLLAGKSRKEASRMFFETLVLTTKDYIHVKQEVPFGFVNVMPGLKLMQSEF